MHWRRVECPWCVCVSYAAPADVAVCHEIGQSVMLDSGAFSVWTRGGRLDIDGFYAWAQPWLDYWTTWAVIPDVIDGDEAANDALLDDWPFGKRGAPVWHMHEDVGRLIRLAGEWPLVCIGSSGKFATVGDPHWRHRMNETMNALCGDGPPPCAIHMLRGLRLAGSEYPFASTDSTTIARNHAGNNQGRNRGQTVRDPRLMADRIDGRQCPARWRRVPLVERLDATSLADLRRPADPAAS